MNYYANYMMQGFGFGNGYGLAWFAPFMILLVAWGLFWKGLALWHSAQRKEGWWFVILLLLNTAGILEIIYLFLVAKIPSNQLFSSKKS